MSLSKPKPSYDFHEALLSEIFKRLPIKYVLRCGAVQKSWYNLIKSPLFISLHSEYSKLTAHINPKYLLFLDISNSVMTLRSDDKQCQEYCTFDYPLDLPACSWHTQSNGLICMSNMFDSNHDFNPDIYLWNPLVQKYKIVLDSPLSTFTFEETNWNALAFGFLPEVHDYVVVHIVKPKATSEPDSSTIDTYKQYPHSVMISVYSLNTNSWKKMCQDKVFVDFPFHNQSVFVNGTAFWVAYDLFCQVIMFFDTKSNILRKITVPSWVALHERQLAYPLILPFGQYIAYFVEVGEDDLEEDEGGDDDYGSPHLDIWVFKDDMIGKEDVKDELLWEKRMSVGLSENVWAEVLGIRNNCEPILAISNKFISYDLETHMPYVFIGSYDHFTSRYNCKENSQSPFAIFPFVETLILHDID